MPAPGACLISLVRAGPFPSASARLWGLQPPRLEHFSIALASWFGSIPALKHDKQCPLRQLARAAVTNLHYLHRELTENIPHNIPSHVMGGLAAGMLTGISLSIAGAILRNLLVRTWSGAQVVAQKMVGQHG